jgi:LacI family transcriptional regulator
MAKRPTQADVAKLAGVSRTTVSYVLSDHSGGRIPISQETRRKVLKAADTLGYEVNVLGRSLRSGSSQAIGLLIPSVHNPHFLDILTGVQDIISERGYYLALFNANLEPKQERGCIRALLQRRFDGLILLPTFLDLFASEMERCAQRSCPAVFTLPVEGADWVTPDARTGAGLLVDHLFSLGHERIGFIHGVPRQDIAHRRLGVYRDKISTRGLPLDEQLIRRCGSTIQDGYDAARELLALPAPPTAIWSVNDLLAVGALRAVRAQGLDVPGDISLVGFQDIALASQLTPPLTTVRTDGRELGRQAAQMLFRRIQEPDREPMQKTLDTKLIVRQSTGLARLH